MNRDSPQKRKKLQTMRQLCIERKAQNFESLKKWDQGRASKLIIHRKIVDQIDQTLELKLSQSNQYTKIVKQFFIDLLSQKNRYLSHFIQNPEAKIKLNKIGRDIYPTASKSLIKLYDSTQNSREFYRVKKVLEESLSKIDDFLLQSEKQLMQLRTKIELLVLDIQDSNMQTLQKCDNLVTIYNQAKNLKAFQAQQDFFVDQQGFLQQAAKQIYCQKQLGNQIVQYLEYVQKRQVQKLNVLKKLIGEYINCITSENELQSQHLLNLSQILHKNTQTKYIEEYFSVEDLLPRQMISQLAKVQRKHQNQINIKYLKAFLRKFEYEQFDDRNLILKILKVYLRNKSTLKDLQSADKNQQQSHHQLLQPVEIIVTVDGYINIYHHQFTKQEDEQTQEQVETLLHNLKITPSLIFNRISDIELEINVKKWGLMSFTENEEYAINLIFNSEDQREEFVEFAIQLK